MFLLRLTAKHSDVVKIIEDRQEALRQAAEFVGEHNPVDGCSTRPVQATYCTHYVIERQTSFGRRAAYIFVATTTEPLTFNIAYGKTR